MGMCLDDDTSFLTGSNCAINLALLCMLFNIYYYYFFFSCSKRNDFNWFCDDFFVQLFMNDMNVLTTLGSSSTRFSLLNSCSSPGFYVSTICVAILVTGGLDSMY